MPSGPAYATIGEFYAALQDALQACAEAVGEQALFIGPREVQLRPQEIDSESLRVVTSLADAMAAIDRIVVDGEGSPAEREASHFAQFRSIRDEYRQLLAERPAFEPARRVARHPVMHAVVEKGRTHVSQPTASRVLDAANATYGLMLRCLDQCYATAWHDLHRADIVQAALACMAMLGTLGRALTRLPAALNDPEVMAGVSFAMPRSIEPVAAGIDGRRILAERAVLLQTHCRDLPDDLFAAVRGDLARLVQLTGGRMV